MSKSYRVSPYYIYLHSTSCSCQTQPGGTSAPIIGANTLPHRLIPACPGVGSRVAVGYFDREGVDQLHRMLTHLSETQRAKPEQVGASKEKHVYFYDVYITPKVTHSLFACGAAPQVAH